MLDVVTRETDKSALVAKGEWSIRPFKKYDDMNIEHFNIEGPQFKDEFLALDWHQLFNETLIDLDPAKHLFCIPCRTTMEGLRKGPYVAISFATREEKEAQLSYDMPWHLLTWMARRRTKQCFHAVVEKTGDGWKADSVVDVKQYCEWVRRSAIKIESLGFSI